MQTKTKKITHFIKNYSFHDYKKLISFQKRIQTITNLNVNVNIAIEKLIFAALCSVQRSLKD